MDERTVSLAYGSAKNEQEIPTLLIRYDVSELYDVRRLRSAMAALPWPERRAKAERYVFLKDRCLCVGAGLLCAYALRSVGAHDLAMGYGAHGKPYLLHYPNIHFNVSHSETLAVCAVSGAPVGVDVEKRQSYDEGVARLCYTNAELAWLEQQEDASRAFTRLWTRKESYLKLLGTGLSKPANSFAAVPGSCFELRVRFEEYDYDDYSLCVCMRTQAAAAGEGSSPSVFNMGEAPSFESMVTEGP